MKNEKELQKKYVYGQLLKQQAGALIEEKGAIEARIAEISMTKEAIKRIGGMKKDDMMWSPIGSGAFMISRSEDTDNILVSVGAGVLVKMPRGRATEVLASRLEEIEDVNTKVTTELSKYAEQIGALESEMKDMIESEQHKKEMKTPRQHKSGEKVQGTGG
ncbi:MAG: prefoldin subunit alpha [Candidatus Aenigmarchaeota archaeon]|nr:prefoldin subunit alpha [Candidatus Aenigmarchaeota archaeon]